MASRSVRPKVLRNLRRLKSGARHSATATASDVAVLPILLNEKPETIVFQPNTTRTSITLSGLNFEDGKLLFQSVSTLNLMKSVVALSLAAFRPIAELGLFLLNSSLMNDPIFRKVVLEITERTFYRYFCAGKDLTAANETARTLWQSGLSAMLDYGLEHANDNESCDKNTEEFIRTIDSTKLGDDGPVSFVVVKITAICPPHLLKRVSDLLRWEYIDNSLKLPWKLKSLPVLSECSPFYHTLLKPEPLTPEEENDLESAYDRFFKICESSLEANIPLLIDAEDTSIQPAIDYLTYSALSKYGSLLQREALIFNTIQTYLKDSKDRLWIAKKAADKMKIPLGIKLVRGAYMTTENRLAASLGVNSPIHDCIQDTHDCYGVCTDFMLEQIVKGSGSVVLATHNIESGKMAALKAISMGIHRNDRNLQFAQLYGMAQTLSYGLRNAGFRVSKYLPFGPVEQIMPYLLRRAEENRALLGASTLDRVLMRRELIRRLKSPGS